MKFRKSGQVLLAAVVSIGSMFGIASCNDFTVGYVYISGTQYNQIGAYREDNNNGILTPVVGSPIGSGGTNPVRMIIPSGGHFMYVLNAGTRGSDPNTAAAPGSIAYAGANISVFSIGGFGQLSFQHSYNLNGVGPIRIAADSAGTHLMVLDSYAPIADASGNLITSGGTSPSATFPCSDTADSYYRPVGAVEVFDVDTSTGRLSVVSNQQNQGLTYFPVGCNPVDFHLTPSYLYIMDAGSIANSDLETVFEYAFGGSTGQLTVTQNAPLQTGAVAVDAIDGDAGNSHIYLIDPASGTGGTIFPYTIGSLGALQAISGGATVNSSTAAGNPQQLITVSGSPNTFVYVANAGPASGNTNGNSDISGYVINSATGHLDNPTYLSPYIGQASGLVCLLEDPSNQYIYAVGAADNSVSGRKLDPATGSLKPLNRATAFPVVGTPSWCVATAAQ